MSRLVRIHFCMISVLLFSATAFASDHKLTKSWSLSHFMLENQQITLKSVNGSYDFSFPISDRINPLSIELNLVINNSNLLQANRAQFVVYINDYIIGQIKLDPVNHVTQPKFVIDKDYLRAGYNHISFRVAQHYTETQCEDWSAPELWTMVNSEKSTLTLTYEYRPVTAKLSELNSLINDKLDAYALSILRPDETVTDDYLYWGALIAQGVQLRLKYVPMILDEQPVAPYAAVLDASGKIGRFNINPEQLKHDAVLLGTKSQLEKLLPVDISQTITGPYLGLFRQDQNQANFILIVSGTNVNDVKTAVQTFSLLTSAFPDSQQTVVDKATFPANQGVYPKNSILPDRTYQFSQLGFIDQSLNADHPDTKLDIHIPPDLYGSEDEVVKINLNLAYGAGMRKDSVINISLNGLFNHAIQLKETEGAQYRNYQISIPLRSFKAGVNTMKFSSVLTPSEYGKCAYVQRDNLLVSIYQDSTITLPNVGRGASLPDLQLLASTSFPLIKDGSAGGTVFKILDNSSDTIASAWQLIAKLAAYFETPVFDLNITQGQVIADKNVVLVGQLSNDNTSVLEGSPVKLGTLSRFPYQYKEQHVEQKESFWEWMGRAVMAKNAPPLPVKLKTENIPIIQRAGLGENFLMVSYPSPNAKDTVVLALVSEKGNALYPGANRLFSSALWRQMKGNIFMWDKQERFYWQQEGDTFLTGQGISRANMIMYFSKHPWQWVVLIVLLLVLIAGLIHNLLTKHKKQAHPQ